MQGPQEHSDEDRSETWESRAPGAFKRSKSSYYSLFYLNLIAHAGQTHFVEHVESVGYVCKE